jgi:hypothetical protein
MTITEMRILAREAYTHSRRTGEEISDRVVSAMGSLSTAMELWAFAGTLYRAGLTDAAEMIAHYAESSSSVSADGFASQWKAESGRSDREQRNGKPNQAEEAPPRKGPGLR